MDYIVGFRTSIAGIGIEPNLPAAWKKVTAIRRFRGKTIRLTVHNQNGNNSGVEKLLVNGQIFNGSVIEPELFTEDLLLVEAYL